MPAAAARRTRGPARRAADPHPPARAGNGPAGPVGNAREIAGGDDVADAGGNGHSRNGNGLLKEQAYGELKELLLAGELAGEPFLSERKLAKRLGMSNTPVRSAIERLEAEGVIAISPQQGITVREPTDREIADGYEIREAIEPFVVRRLAGRLSADEIAGMRANCGAYLAAIAAGDRRNILRVDGEFHMLLCRFFGNADVTRCLLRLRDRFYRVILRAAALMPGRMVQSGQEHVRIAEALAAGDADAAAAAMLEHLDKGRRLLLPDWRRA